MTRETPDRITTNSPEETEKFGESLSRTLAPGDTLLLYGDLGAGKTTLTRGICRGLGISIVKSPSFVIVNVYAGKFTVYHIDLYRVESLDPETAGEISEYMWDEDAIKIVEWAEHLPDELIPTGAIRIKLTRKSENQRTITVEREKND